MKLIEQIAAFSSPNVFNPWRDTDPLDRSPRDAAMLRRTRLAQHFDCQPEYLLIGEAPGYQGCHFAGVAFTNERLLMDGVVPRASIGCERITTRDKPWSEPSASIVWAHLHALGIADKTVMWNAFAWHPHKPDEPMSNRAPTSEELWRGKPILTAVVEHFRGAKVIAVGRVAQKALAACYVRWSGCVRHPSMGGANQFRSELSAICTQNPSTTRGE